MINTKTKIVILTMIIFTLFNYAMHTTIINDANSKIKTANKIIFECEKKLDYNNQHINVWEDTTTQTKNVTPPPELKKIKNVTIIDNVPSSILIKQLIE